MILLFYIAIKSFITPLGKPNQMDLFCHSCNYSNKREELLIDVYCSLEPKRWCLRAQVRLDIKRARASGPGELCADGP